MRFLILFKGFNSLSAKHRLQTVECRLLTTDWAINCKLRVNCRLQTRSKMQTKDYRFLKYIFPVSSVSNK